MQNEKLEMRPKYPWIYMNKKNLYIQTHSFGQKHLIENEVSIKL